MQVRKHRKGLKAFVPSEVDPDTVPYADAAREKARQKALRKAAQQGEGKPTAGKKHACEERAAKAEERKVAEKKLPAAKRQLQQQREDVGDLDDDYRMYRKHKKGKVADDEYKKSIGLLD